MGGNIEQSGKMSALEPFTQRTGREAIDAFELQGQRGFVLSEVGEIEPPNISQVGITLEWGSV